VQPAPQLPALDTSAGRDYRVPAGINSNIDQVSQDFVAGNITIEDAKGLIPGGEKGPLWPIFDSRVAQINQQIGAIKRSELRGQPAMDATLRVAPNFGYRLAGYITGATAPPSGWTANKRPYADMIELGQNIDGTFTQQVFASRGKTMQDYINGPASRQMVAYSTAVLHSASTRSLLPQKPEGFLGKGIPKDISLQNWYLSNYAPTQGYGADSARALAQYRASIDFLVPEASRAAMAGNKPYEGENKEWRKNLGPDQNINVIGGTLDIIDHRLAEKSFELEQQWMLGTGQPLKDMVLLFSQHDPLGFGYDKQTHTTHAQRVQAIANAAGLSDQDFGHAGQQ